MGQTRLKILRPLVYLEAILMLLKIIAYPQHLDTRSYEGPEPLLAIFITT